MQIAERIDLTEFNTLALPAYARYYARVETIADIHEAIAWAQQERVPLLPLGGGSNVVLRGEFPGLVLHIALQGKALTRCENYCELRAAAGENWHALVQWSLQQQAYGLENLTLIPGTVGAAPIQNIGAYGVELSHFLYAVRGIEIDKNRALELTAAQCELGYRDSIFKHALRGKFIVTEIVLHLRNRFIAAIDYPALREQLALSSNGAAACDALQVERAVRAIRESKLPDPRTFPNAGSFFKNPVIPFEKFAELQKAYPELPHYAAVDGVKIPAAWLIDRSSWKGFRQGAVGVHAQQALVLINYGGADANELLALAARIQSDVMQRFNIAMELEPTVCGS